MSDALERLKGALADRYAIMREIGSGGMAKRRSLDTTGVGTTKAPAGAEARRIKASGGFR